MSNDQRIVVIAIASAMILVCAIGYLLLGGSDSDVAAVPESATASEPVTASEPASTEPPTREPQGKPFEYKILSEEWHDPFVGKGVTVEAQVADDVAPTVTEADLESLVPVFMEKYNGQTFQVFFYTETPLVQAWGVIAYTPYATIGDKLECQILKYAFEFGPWYFPDRIDPGTKWHDLVWLTLPMVNKIVNGATEFQWEVTRRSANAVYFDSKQSPPGAFNDDMNLDPQTWEISTHDGDVPRFVRLVESSLNYLDPEFSQNIVEKLNSVIGSQEYLSGDKTYWNWMIGRLEVTYHHYDKSDMLTIMQTPANAGSASP